MCHMLNTFCHLQVISVLSVTSVTRCSVERRVLNSIYLTNTARIRYGTFLTNNLMFNDSSKIACFKMSRYINFTLICVSLYVLFVFS